MSIQCALCDHTHHSLINHVSTHGLTVEEYVQTHGAVISDEVFKKLNRKLKREPLTKLTVKFGAYEFDVDTNVKAEDVLPFPSNYQLPRKGDAGKAMGRALRALKNGRRVFVWGMPGVGKDALVHAFSALTRRPALALTFDGESDLSGWFYKQVLDSNGTHYEYGKVWKAVTEGVLGTDGKRRAPLILLSDVDRANSAQAELFRMMADTTSGRMLGPHGNMVPLFKDEWGNRPQLVCTANSVGSGDARGRMTSSNPIDGSILDRLGAKVQGHYMVWSEEGEIMKSMYPQLVSTLGDTYWNTLGEVTKLIRKSIDEGELYGEFTIRGLITVCNDASDIVEEGCTSPKEVLKEALQSWTDGLDVDERFELTRLLDAVLDTL